MDISNNELLYYFSIFVIEFGVVGMVAQIVNYFDPMEKLEHPISIYFDDL